MQHRSHQNAEAGPSTPSAASQPSRDASATSAAGASGRGREVPNIAFDQKAVNEIANNSKWRKAFFVDGELRWATREGNGIGEKVPVEGGQVYNMRQFGDVLYLAPKEAHEGTGDDIQAANKKRVEAFLDRVVAKMVAESPKVPPPKYEEIRPFFSENLDAILPLVTRDGLLAMDTHGYIDNDFDNEGPCLNKETQFITRGYHSLMNQDKDSVFERLGKQLTRALLPLSKAKYESGEDDGEEPGYESGGSNVSTERCRESPAYSSCGDNCWLKQAASIPRSSSQSCDKPAKITTLDAIDIYAAINRGFTRVLVIEPGPRDEQIRCKLEPMKILGVREEEQDSPVERRLYEALSYTWGDATKCHIIECNGRQFGVSQNLFDALINIRRLDKPRTIWIDALCINQDNDAEKSEQVRHMYAIYRAATRVIVWLGNEANDSDFTMQATAFLRTRKNRATIMRRDHKHQCLVQLARVIAGIEALTERPWFFRSWIRQEVAAAPKVTVRCGSREVPWTALKRSVNCLTRLRGKYVASRSLFNGGNDEFEGLVGPQKERALALRFLKKDWVVGQSLLADAGDLRSIWYYHTGGMLELLMAGRAYDATDARDKVYAILGMAEVPLNPRELSPRLLWAKEAEKEGPLMKIDYSASVSEVYQHTAKYLINRDENLDILCILPTHRDEASHDLPSWTPDWRVSLKSRPLYENWDFISYKWGASGFTTTDTQDQADLNRLNVKGFEIARIVQLLPLFPNTMPHPPESPTGSAVPFEEGKHIRRFAQTTEGPSIAPSTAVVGDAVWILYGCKMPIVLRPMPGTLGKGRFQVIGPCYVSTIMFGEAIEWLMEGERDLELASIVLF